MADICQWDVATWSEAVSLWERRVRWTRLRCLELGANKGGLSLWLALKGCDVVCSNVSDAASLASPLHQRYGIDVTYADINAVAIPFENQFDLVVFKSLLGALKSLERQYKAIEQMHKALKPGGALLFAENLTATALHRYMRLKFRYRKEWRYVTIDELKQLLTRFSSFELHTAGVLAAFGTNEIQRTAFALVDQMVLRHICPATWKYLGFGIAYK